MIWNLSKFYNTEERLTGLLRKISNEVGTKRAQTAAHPSRCDARLPRGVGGVVFRAGAKALKRPSDRPG